jgi:hypothetical protein
MIQAPAVPTTQRAGCQDPPMSLQFTHTQTEGARAEMARFDIVLEKISRQRTVVAQHAGRHTVNRKRQTEAEEKARGAEETKAVEEAEATEEAEISKEVLLRLRRYVPAPVAQSQSYTRRPICMHKMHWTAIPGRWRCEYHLYSPNRYRNPFRFRCPGCNAVACGHCMKKLKRGDTVIQ